MRFRSRPAASCATTWCSRSRPSRRASPSSGCGTSRGPRCKSAIATLRSFISGHIRKDWLAQHKIWGGQGVNWIDDAQRKALLAEKPEKEWSVALPATDDYRERTEEVQAPEDLKTGYYWLLSSQREDFDADYRHMNNAVSITDFWVSRLAMVCRFSNIDGRLQGFILDAASGEPIEGAQVQIYGLDWHGASLPGPRARPIATASTRCRRSIST